MSDPTTRRAQGIKFNNNDCVNTFVRGGRRGNPIDGGDYGAKD